MNNIDELYHSLLRPTDELLCDISALEGDILILGAGGKMGPALARLAKQAVDIAGVKKEILAVSRFTEAGLQHELGSHGISTIAADMLIDQQLQTLPETPNVLYLAGTKFGTTGNKALTWAMNTYLPGRVAEKYRRSRIVVFSTGNVYPLTPVDSRGATEEQLPAPVGEYAQSCLGRERMFQYFAATYQTPLLIYRLNYANDVSYGVLLEIAKSVKERKPIDLQMGYVNVIWQSDANEIALRALHHCQFPPEIMNVTGPETISIRWLAKEFGKIFEVEPAFVNDEETTALLSNSSQMRRVFGKPRVSLAQMVKLVAAWVLQGGKTLNKPTHFQERHGNF